MITLLVDVLANLVSIAAGLFAIYVGNKALGNGSEGNRNPADVCDDASHKLASKNAEDDPHSEV